MSRVIDWAKTGLGESHTDEAFAYFYCNRAEETRRSPESILRSLVRQLSTTVTKEKFIHEMLRDLKKVFDLQGRSPDTDTCRDVLIKLLNSYPATTIILDALDECDDATRYELMEILDQLMASSRKPLKILISSRPNVDIKSHFQGHPRIEIQAIDNQADIEDFVRDKLSQGKLRRLSEDLKGEVVRTLFDGSKGMFQWAALQIQQLSELKLLTEANIRSRLGQLPETLEDAYKEMWTSIEGLSKYEKEFAERAFRWVLCASEPMTTAQLATAILIDPGSDDPDSMERKSVV